jgi:hypothetical protein
MFGRQSDCIDRTVQPAQMADLAIELMRNHRMAAGRINAQHIGGANVHTGFAPNTALNLSDGHFHLLLSLEEIACCRL